MDTDLEGGLIILPVERGDPTSAALCICASLGFGLILGGVILIGYLFDKKIWI